MNPPVTAGKILDAMPILREDSISNLTATTVSTESARNLSDCFNESFSTPSIGHETSSITSSSRRKKKSVSWSKKRQWRRHHRICDLSKEEQEAVWYTPEDSKIILAMARVTVKMMMNGEVCDDVDYCSRGLEGKTLEGSKIRKENKHRLKQAVFAEQEVQFQENVWDPKYLAMVSESMSQKGVREAYIAGLQDAKSVREYIGRRFTRCPEDKDTSKTSQQD